MEIEKKVFKTVKNNFGYFYEFKNPRRTRIRNPKKKKFLIRIRNKSFRSRIPAFVVLHIDQKFDLIILICRLMNGTYSVKEISTKTKINK